MAVRSVAQLAESPELALEAEAAGVEEAVEPVPEESPWLAVALESVLWSHLKCCRPPGKRRVLIPG